VAPRNIIFYAGDVLHDESLQDIGVLVERYVTTEEVGGQKRYGVPVWKMWWIRAGEEHYSEEGLQHLVALDVFIRYSVRAPLKLEKI
jgi:hypothetical protein